MQDMRARGRDNPPRGNRNGTRTHPEIVRGENNGRALLIESQVRDIRSRVGQTQASIAAEFGITRGMVGHIRRGLAWKHVV